MLLDAGKKVVLGGSLVFLGPSPQDVIRKSLFILGVDNKNIDNNLIIVKGYVDLYTNLYKIVNEWKDIELTDPNVPSMWDCNFDYLHSELFQIFTKDWNQVCFAFNDKCWWNKCKFCNYSKLSQIDYIDGVSDDKIIEHINRQLELYRGNEIKFIDNYFTFTDRTEYILDNINAQRIGIYTGIPYLKRKGFIDSINRHKISMIHIGLESTSDFTLDKIRKGYQYKDVLQATDNIINNINKDVIVSMMLIMDLPAKSKSSIRNAYNRLIDIRDMMLEAGIRFDYSAGLLQLSPGIDIADGKLIRIQEEYSNECSGEGYLTNAFRQLKLPGYLPHITNYPYKRFTPDGEYLPSDLTIIGEERLNKIFNFERDYNVD
jgi:hypothetical protein